MRFNAVGAGPLKTSASAGIPGIHRKLPLRGETDFSEKEPRDAGSGQRRGISAERAQQRREWHDLVVDAGLGSNYFDQEIIRLAMRPADAFDAKPAKRPSASTRHDSMDAFAIGSSTRCRSVEFRRMKFENVCIESLAVALPDEVWTSADIEERLRPLYERLKLPVGRLELMTGIRERRMWPAGTRPSDASAAAGRAVLGKVERSAPSRWNCSSTRP